MGLYRFGLSIVTACLLSACTQHYQAKAMAIPSPLEAPEARNGAKSKTLFLMQQGAVTESIQSYHDIEGEDYKVLQSLATILLEQGANSSDPEEQLLTVYGVGISQAPKLYYILAGGLRSRIPQIQLASIHFLAQCNDHAAIKLLHRAMASQFLLARLEAAFVLAQQQHQSAVGQIEALMIKTPPELTPLFPELFAIEGSLAATKQLTRLLHHSNPNVSIAAIHSAASYQRDDLLPEIRALSKQLNPAQQEACAFAFKIFEDQKSIPILQNIRKSHMTNTRLAALHALHTFGFEDMRFYIERFASQGDLYAIQVLGEIPQSENLLVELMEDSNDSIRINAAIALLKHRNPVCSKALSEILISNSKELALQQVFSAGKSQSYYKSIYSASSFYTNTPYLAETAAAIRENLLRESLELPTETFLSLAIDLLEARQNDLAPLIIDLVASIQSPEATLLLKKYAKQAGSPLIRQYCILALYRLNIPGPYQEQVQQWITEHNDLELIQLRPFIPWSLRQNESPYELSPTESSKLLIESYQALASKQDTFGINALLQAIAHGNPKNRYGLAGLLLRATE